MQAEQLEAKRHAQAIDGSAAHHRRNRAHLVRSLEEQRAHKNPAKCRFKTAEREHVDLPNNARRNHGKHEYDNAHAQGDNLARTRHDGIAYLLAPIVCIMQPQVFDNGR